MITPQTHPTHFRPVQLGPYIYDTPKRYSLRVQEAISDMSDDFFRDYYRREHSAELKDGTIDEEKFAAWSASTTDAKENRKVNNLFLIAKAKIFLIPRDGAPSVDSEEFWDTATFEELYQVFSFTTPMLANKNDGQTTSALDIPDSPDSKAEA